MMSYLRVFFNLFPNLEEDKQIHETTAARDADEAKPPYRWSSSCRDRFTSRHLQTKLATASRQMLQLYPEGLVKAPETGG